MIADHDDRPALAHTDAAGRLLEADARLVDLIRRCGGDGIGAPFPLPPLAALERLARRLGIMVARTIVIGDGDDRVELDVRAEPATGGVVLHIGGWRLPDGKPSPPGDVINQDAGTAWEVDAALSLVRLPRLAGTDPSDALGRPLTQIFAIGDGPLLYAVAGRAPFDRQEASVRATGERVLLSARPRHDAFGRFAGFVGSLEVVAATADATDDPFAAGFGTQLDRALRRPIQRIIANAGSMSAEVEGPLGERYTGYADDIAVAGRHLLGLVEDLVDLDSVERADFALPVEPIDLADVARRAAGLLGVRAADGDIAIDRPDGDAALPATGDYRRALQVMVNLIGNAVRYSPPGGTVWVRASRDGDRACVIVADQGKGIAADDQALVFEKFGRVDPGESGGSGLGLYISRRLARAMGGDLTVDSAAGEGARFVFTLPAR